MSDNKYTIPFDRLPPGFAETLDNPPDEPVRPRPAATVVLLRDGPGGMETLMLRRTRRSGFVPGAWVFAGGRVDPADQEAAVLERVSGLSAEAASRRLAMDPGQPASAGAAYYVAALREAFEETGLLVGRRRGGGPVPGAGDDPAVEAIRDALLADRISLATALDRLEAELSGGEVEYIAHWITPVQEPRRYDTRFFAARVEADRTHLLHPSEMTDALWLSPGAVLDRHALGEVPMVFPTIRTLESLAAFESADSALAHFRDREIPAVLPRLVKTSTGVGLEIPPQ